MDMSNLYLFIYLFIRIGPLLAKTQNSTNEIGNFTSSKMLCESLSLFRCFDLGVGSSFRDLLWSCGEKVVYPGLCLLSVYLFPAVMID